MIAAQRILCPIDFSPCSQRAVSLAVPLARRAGAHVTVLNVGDVVNLYPAVVAQVAPVAVAHPTRGERASQAAHFIAPFADVLHPLDIVLAEGDVAATITAAIGAHRIDLVVMGTHGHRGFRRLAVGSIARRVVHTASCPVIVVPPEPAPLPTLKGFERIVCRGAALELSYARTFAETPPSHVDAMPLGAPARDVVTRAAAARADLIVWNRISGTVDEILDRTTVPVLIVSDRVPGSWHRRSAEPVPVARACHL